MFAEVIPSYRMPVGIDAFDYKIPNELKPVIKPGFLVVVPFRNKELVGLVTRIKDRPGIPEKKVLELKLSSLDFAPFTEFDLGIINFVADYYVVSRASILKAILPQMPKRATRQNQKKSDIEPAEKIEAEQMIGSDLKSPGIFIYDNRIKLLENIIGYQKKVNGQILILEPQIRYVESTFAYISRTLPGKITFLHSGLAMGRYWENWLSYVNKEKLVMVSTRLGIFTPSKNLKAIFILDEDLSDFKQYDQNPRYDARTIALKISQERKIPVILGSGAPRLETWNRAKTEKWPIYRDESEDSTISVIDLETERRFKNFSLLSNRLEEACLDTLQNGKKVLLFFNRRGWATSVICQDCGHVSVCPECQLPLIVHKNQLICHHCGYHADVPLACPKCKGTKIKMYGAGTEQLEKEIRATFGKYRVLRLDKDVGTEKRYDLQEYDIILGTNLLIKEYYNDIISRLDVGTVGIINADNLFNIPDFRSTERAWQEIRKIRNLSRYIKAKLLVQTMRPENKVLKNIDNIENFFQEELEARKTFKYPPFSRLVKIFVQDAERLRGKKRMMTVFEYLKKLTLDKDIEIMGPYAATPEKIRNQFRYILVLKAPLGLDLEFLKKMHEDIIIDVDPEFILN